MLAYSSLVGTLFIATPSKAWWDIPIVQITLYREPLRLPWVGGGRQAFHEAICCKSNTPELAATQS